MNQLYHIHFLPQNPRTGIMNVMNHQPVVLWWTTSKPLTWHVLGLKQPWSFRCNLPRSSAKSLGARGWSPTKKQHSTRGGICAEIEKREIRRNYRNIWRIYGEISKICIDFVQKHEQLAKGVALSPIFRVKFGLNIRSNLLCYLKPFQNLFAFHEIYVLDFNWATKDVWPSTLLACMFLLEVLMRCQHYYSDLFFIFFRSL